MQNFMLVSKIQTYLSDKMHLKKVITNESVIFFCKSQFSMFICNNFF
jgi:hypothetical protein